eukprot:PITA_26012
MKEEMDSLVHNQTWDIVRLHVGKITLQNKWVYRLKEEYGGRKRYKVILVVKGFAQKRCIDFDELFSPIVKMTSIITILSLVEAKDLHLEQLDVKTTFLHGDLDEEIFMQQPQGYEVKGKKKLVSRLNKSLYGLKRVPRQCGISKKVHEQSRKKHSIGVKWILWYLRGTTYQALCFGGADIALQGYVDVDMVGDKDNRRSTIGCVFTVVGTIISWVSKLESVIALSTTEVEDIVAIEASKEMIWLQRFLDELGKNQELVRLHNDIQSAIYLAKNSVFHSNTKDI